MIKYPKPVMKMSELVAMGFAKDFLMYAYRKNTAAIAWKMNPTKSNSPILFDTEGLEKFRQAQARVSK